MKCTYNANNSIYILYIFFNQNEVHFGSSFDEYAHNFCRIQFFSLVPYTPHKYCEGYKAPITIFYRPCDLLE